MKRNELHCGKKLNKAEISDFLSTQRKTGNICDQFQSFTGSSAAKMVENSLIHFSLQNCSSSRDWYILQSNYITIKRKWVSRVAAKIYQLSENEEKIVEESSGTVKLMKF